MKIIDWLSHNWASSSGGVFAWPHDVAVRLPNGDVYDCTGGRNADGISIDNNPDGTGAIDSPCGQALLAHGLIAAKFRKKR